MTFLPEIDFGDDKTYSLNLIALLSCNLLL